MVTKFTSLQLACMFSVCVRIQTLGLGKVHRTENVKFDMISLNHLNIKHFDTNKSDRQ